VPARVIVIGLDCAPPALLFDRYRDAMPALSGLMAGGTWGPLRSTVPPITVPAWPSMVSGRDPGELGLYGFRKRRRGSYDLELATSSDVKVKRLWDRVGDAGLRAAALFVPLTWPPSPLRGDMVSCFLTPGPESGWAFPPSLKPELEAIAGPYLPDVPGYRAGDPARVLEGARASARQHFAIARHLWRARRPDFLMMVEMGPDRVHHALYHLIDPASPRYDARYDEAARAYYASLDGCLAELLDAAGDATVLVVSDHGARTMEGAVRINEWLRREGWLALRGETPPAPASLRDAGVDWARTRAWGEGGYYARVFLNVRGREPEGALARSAYEAERERLERALLSMRGPDGRPLDNVVVRPERAFREVRGDAPDLLVFFGDLAYRSIGTVGGDLFSDDNDTGPDGCNHDWDGVLVLGGAGARARGRLDGMVIYDVGATVLGLLGVEAPADLLGTDRSAA
jgi:predicted AlkP superfamily phosphohydrolase/phosphomutase